MRARARPLRFAMLAGEPSGDRLGAALMTALRAEAGRPVEFVGVGGPAMEAAGGEHGFESLFPIADIAVMGFTEVAGRLRQILKRMNEATEALAAAQADAVITIDAPSFGLRVVKKMRRKLEQPPLFVHYVAPSVWAWRPGRAKKLAKTVDHLLALLPFEPPYFHAEGLSCDFVGHPIVERVASMDLDAAPSLRAAHGIAADAPLAVALLGSRPSEVERLAEPFGEAMRLLSATRPGLVVISPLAETVADLAQAKLADWPVRTIPLDPRETDFATSERRKFKAYAQADVALAASGTVSLELGSVRTPMVIGYRVSAISAAIARRLLKVDTATLVNLVSETRAVPEFIQENCRPELIASALEGLFDPISAARVAQMRAAEETMLALGEGGEAPSRRAARSVLTALERHPHAKPSATQPIEYG